MIKAGFAGDRLPKAVFPALYVVELPHYVLLWLIPTSIVWADPSMFESWPALSMATCLLANGRRWD